MLSSLPVSLFSLFLASATSVHAFDISVRVRTPASTNGLNTRASSSIIPVANTHNAEYIANITLGGREIPVLLDTGRYALIFAPPVSSPLTPVQLRPVGDRDRSEHKGHWKGRVYQLCRGHDRRCVRTLRFNEPLFIISRQATFTRPTWSLLAILSKTKHTVRMSISH